MSRTIKNQRELIMMPGQQKIMETVGEQIRLARLRRKLPSELVAERANISRQTLWKIEKGNSSVCMGMYLKVLAALGLEKDLLLLAKDDTLGRLLQDAELESRRPGRR